MIPNIRSNKLAGFIEAAALNATNPSQAFVVPAGQYFVGSLSTNGSTAVLGNTFWILAKGGNVVLTGSSGLNGAASATNAGSCATNVVLQAGSYTLSSAVTYTSASGNVCIEGALYYL